MNQACRVLYLLTLKDKYSPFFKNSREGKNAECYYDIKAKVGWLTGTEEQTKEAIAGLHKCKVISFTEPPVMEIKTKAELAAIVDRIESGGKCYFWADPMRMKHTIVFDDFIYNVKDSFLLINDLHQFVGYLERTSQRTI